MDRKEYIKAMKKTLSHIRLRIQRKGSDKEATGLLPHVKRAWSPPVCAVVLSHDDEKIKEGDIEILVYVFSAIFNHKKISGLEMAGLLAFSAAVQTGLVKIRGYEYDRAYECHDGSVVLFKKIPLENLSEELSQILILTAENQKM